MVVHQTQCAPREPPSPPGAASTLPLRTRPRRSGGSARPLLVARPSSRKQAWTLPSDGHEVGPRVGAPTQRRDPDRGRPQATPVERRAPSTEGVAAWRQAQVEWAPRNLRRGNLERQRKLVFPVFPAIRRGHTSRALLHTRSSMKQRFIARMRTALDEIEQNAPADLAL